MGNFFRSYFSKNNTLIEDNRTNNSQNPVTELFYGTINKSRSRFIFDINLEPLINKIQSEQLSNESIKKHELNLTNTIRYRPDLIGKEMDEDGVRRTSSFILELFEIDESWDEGNGYTFLYDEDLVANPIIGYSNWFNRTSEDLWNISGGSYQSGQTRIIATQRFDKGNEDIKLDITDYVNELIFSGTSGQTYGFGIKYIDEIEDMETVERQSVGFHTKYTNTFYEPYLETEFNNTIIDNRYDFKLDENNKLYFINYRNNKKEDIDITKVEILDYEGELYQTFTGDSIIKQSKGVYYVELFIDSDDYPDRVIFNDLWYYQKNSKERNREFDFYITPLEDNYDNFNPDKYFIRFSGLKYNENVLNEGIRKIVLDIKELYPNQNYNKNFDVYYRLFIKQTENHEINVIENTLVDYINNNYEILLDTSWLIPQDYYLEISLYSNDIKYVKEKISFSVNSNGFF